MASFGSILGIVPNLSRKLARVYITPLEQDGSIDLKLGSKGLPYWPETVNDSKGANWDEKAIPGGSYPLYQFIAGSSRTITFTIVLNRDSSDVDTIVGNKEDVHNIDVAGAIAWLRAMEYPLYAGGNNTAVPPPTLLLVFPNSKLGLDGTDQILCIMTQCDVEYQAWFNDGTPRHATVSVSFFEIMQDPSGQTTFVGRDTFYELASRYIMDPKPR